MHWRRAIDRHGARARRARANRAPVRAQRSAPSSCGSRAEPVTRHRTSGPAAAAGSRQGPRSAASAAVDHRPASVLRRAYRCDAWQVSSAPGCCRIVETVQAQRLTPARRKQHHLPAVATALHGVPSLPHGARDACRTVSNGAEKCRRAVDVSRRDSPSERPITAMAAVLQSNVAAGLRLASHGWSRRRADTPEAPAFAGGYPSENLRERCTE